MKVNTEAGAPPLRKAKAKPAESDFTQSAAGAGEVKAAKTVEGLRLQVSGAVNRINLALYEQLCAVAPNPVIAGVLTATQFSQLMPALSPEQQKTILGRLGLSDLTPQELVTGTRAFAAQLSDELGAKTKLNQASLSYVQKGKQLNPAIEGGAMRSIDFAAEGAERINGDISKATNRKITELVKQGDVAELDALLAAAAYLESPWGEGISFDPDNTSQREFKVDGSAPVYAELMVSEVAEHRLAKRPDWEAVYLPNGTAGNLGTLYIKPASGSLKDFIAAQGDEGLQGIIAELTNPVARKTRGAVRIPRTEMSFKPDSDALLKALQSLGLPASAQLLDGASVDITRAAYVGKADTTEEGIKMAAAQGFTWLEAEQTPPEPIVFDGNRSMLQLVIKDGQVLFFNPIVDPTAE